MTLLEPEEHLLIYVVKFATGINSLEEHGGVEGGEHNLTADFCASRHVQLSEVGEEPRDEREEFISDSFPPNYNGLYPYKGLWNCVLDIIKFEFTV